jgi:ketosteroid isomerase-like protein
MNMKRITLTFAAALIAVSALAAAQPTNPGMPAMQDAKPGTMQGMPGMPNMQGMQGMQAMLKLGGAPEAEAAAQAFEDALRRGDREAAIALLAPDAQISEGGKSQSRDDYAARHLGEDIAFLKDAKIRLISRTSMAMGDSAQVVSDSEIHIRNGNPVVLRSHAQMALKRTNGHWKITAIVWSSQGASG